jgi:hypothetical protein
MKSRWIAIASVGTLATLITYGPMSGTQVARPPKLYKDGRQLLAILRAQGRPDASVLLMAKSGASEAVAKEAERLKGTVRYRNDDIGYLRVRVPLENVQTLVRFEQLDAATLDFDDALPRFLGATDALPSPSSAHDSRSSSRDPGRLEPSSGRIDSVPDRKWPPRVDDYPLRQLYSPHKDLDADRFLAEHPTWDGRGVTIAVLDGTIDFLNPEMQVAYTADGKELPKVADIINTTDPREDAQDMPQWVNMKEQVTSQGGRITWSGKTYTAPRDGSFRIGVFSERAFNNPANAAYISQDIDRNGNPKDDDGRFAVLWDEATNDVWVDANRDLSFSDQPAMTDYGMKKQIGIFGKDNPNTPIRESIGFAIQTDKVNKFISINVGIYQHGTMVAGALAANCKPNGRFDGVAPGAQVVSVFYGVGQGHGMTEGLITAFLRPDVDVVLLEQNSTLGNDYSLTDGRHLISVLATRLIEKTGKLMLVPGSNAPGLNLVDEPGLASRALSIGGYQSRDSYRTNFGLVPADYDNMHWGGMSHGPGGDGALKPDVLSPSGHMGNDPGYRMGGAREGLYQLPPGYTIGGGTSEATPVATGAVALVISAAKQTKVPHDAARLKAAITGSARWLEKFGAFEQGNGLIQVAAAYKLLSEMASRGERITIESRAPVRTVISQFSETPNEGVGIYEREGWKPGDRGERTITLTRTSGPAESMSFSLAWQGNDGTFTGPSSVALPLRTPVRIAISIAPKNNGVHSAILSLTHPSQPGYVHRVLTTVVAADGFAADKQFTLTYGTDVPRPGERAFYVYVPPGTPALRVDASTRASGLRLDALAPDRGSSAGAFGPTAGPRTVVVERPMPGVWAINVWNGNDGFRFDPTKSDPAPPSPTKVTVQLVGFDVSVSAQSLNGSALPLSATATNRYAPIKAAFGTVSLGSAFTARRAITSLEQHRYEIQVPKGADALLVRASRSSSSDADIDLYLFDCTASEKKCQSDAHRSNTPGGEEWIRVPNPAPGLWVVVVDAYVPQGGNVEYEYFDAFTSPASGAVTVSDIADERAMNGSWSTKGLAWLASSAGGARKPFGYVAVMSPDAKRGGAAPSDPPAFLGFAELPLGR